MSGHSLAFIALFSGSGGFVPGMERAGFPGLVFNMETV